MQLALKTGVFGAGNDFLLQFGRQVAEIIAVARHPHDQVAVGLRRLLGFAERIARDDIELHVMPVQFKVAADEPRQGVQAYLVRQK